MLTTLGLLGTYNGLLVPHLEMKGCGDTVIFPVLHIALGHVMDRLCMASGWQRHWYTVTSVTDTFCPENLQARPEAHGRTVPGRK
jgi:hypothetical protein